MRLNQTVKKRPSSSGKRLKEESLHKVATTRKMNKKKNARSMRVYANHIRLFVGLLIVSILVTLWFLGYPQHLYASSLKGVQQFGISLGFRVQEIIVQGRINTQQQDLMKVLQIDRGDPIFSIDLQQTRFRLEKLEWVRRATVVRRLPDLIHIKIEERHPIAIWQHHNQFHLVDEDGTAILTKNHRHYGVLPLVVGEGAPQKSPDILKILNDFPNIQKNLQALSRVRERRWNIYLVGGVLVKLSDHSLKKGLAILENLLSEQRLSVNNVNEIDLRTPERYFLRVTPETIQRIKAGRKGRVA